MGTQNIFRAVSTVPLQENGRQEGFTAAGKPCKIMRLHTPCYNNPISFKEQFIEQYGCTIPGFSQICHILFNPGIMADTELLLKWYRTNQNDQTHSALPPAEGFHPEIPG
jgi:hypothetical protein